VKLKLNTSLIWPVVVLIIAFGAFYLKPWQTKPDETISVTAEGKTQVAPNIAKITASIESTNPNLDLARQENEQKVSNIVSALKQIGVEEKDIKTEYISGGPGYEIQIYPPQRPNTNQLTTTLDITIRNFNNTDEVIAALTSNGTTNLYGPNLTVADEDLEKAKSKAREAAVENARRKADELAKLSGRKIDKVVKIQEMGDFGYPVPLTARGEADLMEKVQIIQPGQNEVTINLQVDFSLK
jgi:uncharacterized protein YggE